MSRTKERKKERKKEGRKERKARGIPGRPQQLQTEIKVTTRIIYCGMQSVIMFLSRDSYWSSSLC